MTFLELQNQTLRACGHTTAAASEPRTRVKAEINAWQRRLLTRPGFSRLLRDSESSFFSVPQQAVCGLGVPLARLLGIQAVVDRTVLAQRDLAWLRRAGSTATLGTPIAYIPRGWFPVQNNPGTDGVTSLTVKSNNVADVTQIVDWEVITGGSPKQQERGTVTLNGNSLVSIAPTGGCAEVTKFTLRTPALGYVDLATAGSSAIHLCRIAPGHLSARFFHVELFPTPSSAIQYRVDFTREITDLVQDTDVPLLPEDYHHLLAMGAEYDEWRKLSDDRMGPTKQDLETEIRSLNAWLWDLPDDSQLGRLPSSRLGGMFPADTWR